MPSEDVHLDLTLEIGGARARVKARHETKKQHLFYNVDLPPNISRAAAPSSCSLYAPGAFLYTSAPRSILVIRAPVFTRNTPARRIPWGRLSALSRRETVGLASVPWRPWPSPRQGRQVTAIATASCCRADNYSDLLAVIRAFAAGFIGMDLVWSVKTRRDRDCLFDDGGGSA